MDRFITGIAAGIGGFLATFIWNVPANELGFSKLRFMDFAAVMIFGHFPKSPAEEAFALLATLWWHVFLAYLFTLLVPRIGYDHLIGKGAGYGITIWFASYAVTLLFEVPEFRDISLHTSFSNFIGSILFGLAVGYTVKKMRKRVMPAGKN